MDTTTVPSLPLRREARPTVRRALFVWTTVGERVRMNRMKKRKREEAEKREGKL